MSAMFSSLLALPLALGLVLTPLAAHSEAALAAPGGGGASASLNFRIVIPPIMRVLENSHPAVLDLAGGDSSAQQRLVVVSNMKRGFCVNLRLDPSAAAGWQVELAPEPGLSLNPVADGYRLCAARAGRYTVLLQHAFAAGPGGSRSWPVQTDISAI